MASFASASPARSPTTASSSPTRYGRKQKEAAISVALHLGTLTNNSIVVTYRGAKKKVLYKDLVWSFGVARTLTSSRVFISDNIR